MDVASLCLGLLLLFGIPTLVVIARENIKVARIRREWRARGQGYAEGRRFALDPAAATVPQQAGNSWKWAGLASLFVLLLAWFGMMAASTHHAESQGVTVTTRPARSATAARKAPVPKLAAHKRFPHAGACDKIFALNADGYTTTPEEHKACDMEDSERVHDAFQPTPHTPARTAEVRDATK